MHVFESKIKIEELLIRYCARTDISIEQRIKIKKILSPDLDWAYFFKRAQGELLSPLFYKTFLKIEGCQNIVPTDIWQRLKDSYYDTLSSNILRCEELRNIIARLGEKEVPAIVCKGVMLAGLVYADMGLRPGEDIDIVVKKVDVPKADNILRGLGYRVISGIKNLENVRCNNYRNSFLYFYRNGKKAPVHLHWHLINSIPYSDNILRSLDLDSIWQEVESIHLDGMLLSRLSFYHQVIYLSLHAFAHGFYPLILLCDINELLQSQAERLSWGRLVSQAFEFGLSKHLYYALFFCSQLLQTKIPSDVIQELCPKKLSFFEQRFISRVLERRYVFNCESLLLFYMNESFKGKLAFLIRALFPCRMELALAAHKDFTQVTILDYMRRVYFGLNNVAKALLR
jgi:hypothetical protein